MNEPDGTIRCSFCGRSRGEVNALVAGPDVSICDQCLKQCNETIGDQDKERDARDAKERRSRLQSVLRKLERMDFDSITRGSELLEDLWHLTEVDRVTIYALSADRTTLHAQIQVGLDRFRELKLPVTHRSIVGFVAASGRELNISDVHNPRELVHYHPELGYNTEIDKRTRYRTKQMLVLPIRADENSEVLGVIQLVNNKSDLPFSEESENIVREIARGLAKKLHASRSAG